MDASIQQLKRELERCGLLHTFYAVRVKTKEGERYLGAGRHSVLTEKGARLHARLNTARARATSRGGEVIEVVVAFGSVVPPRRKRTMLDNAPCFKPFWVFNRALNDLQCVKCGRTLAFHP